MAINLQTAQRAARERNERPPGGEQPGTPEYDQWVMAWFENGVNAGDPDLVQRAGGGAGAGWGQGQAEEGEGGIAPWEDAAPASEWLGKRKPTPRELRRYARDQGWSEDFQRYDDRQLAQWLNKGGWDINAGVFQGGVQKPTETGGVMAPRRGGGGGGYGGNDYGLSDARFGAGGQAGVGGGGVSGTGTSAGMGGPGTVGGAPAFEFTPPTWEEAMADPGYQFALKQGQQALEGSALARGVGRTSGTLKDLIQFGQDMATQQYGNVYGRQFQLAKDRFAPQYGAWETQYGGDLQKYLQEQGNIYDRWRTQYGGNLQKYLQREGNIYGLINQPPPSYPTWG